MESLATHQYLHEWSKTLQSPSAPSSLWCASSGSTATLEGGPRKGTRGAAEKPSTDLRRPCGPSPGSAPALLAHACTMHSLRCSSLHPDLDHLDRRISRRGFSAGPLAEKGGFAKRRPCRPVDRARAKAANRGAMRRRGVALVVGKPVARVEAVVLDHRFVAGDLGHDARRHDRRARAVAAHDRHLRERCFGDVPGVDQQVFRGDFQTGDRSCCGEVSGSNETQAVHLRVVDGAHGPGERPPSDDRVHALSLEWREELRIVQARYANADRQNNCPAYDRAGERPHANLVHPRDNLVAHRARHALIAPEHWAHCIETSERWLRMPCSLQAMGKGTPPPGPNGPTSPASGEVNYSSAVSGVAPSASASGSS